MPLVKLWNAIRGRSADKEPAIQRPSSAQVACDPIGTAAKKRRVPRRSPHSPLCKAIKSLPAESVLEIGVGDGSRAVAVAQTLGEIRYFAIDQFELSGGEVTLKEFHQTLRGAGVRPQVFPEPIDHALMRFAHTVGTVDLILVSAGCDEHLMATLARVSHEQTVVMQQENESWIRLQNPRHRTRAAA